MEGTSSWCCKPRSAIPFPLTKPVCEVLYSPGTAREFGRLRNLLQFLIRFQCISIIFKHTYFWSRVIHNFTKPLWRKGVKSYIREKSLGFLPFFPASHPLPSHSLVKSADMGFNQLLKQKVFYVTTCKILHFQMMSVINFSLKVTVHVSHPGLPLTDEAY